MDGEPAITEAIRAGERDMSVAAAVRPELLDDAMRYCRRVTRQRARNFYYGLCLLPREKRYALYTIYAWMRRADDLVDDAESNDLAYERLMRFQQRTSEILRGGATADEALNGSEEKLLWPALQHVNERFSLDARRFHEMIDGQLSDLRRNCCQTMDDLLHYCRLVASTVGLICIDIWGYDDDDARQLAVDCGVAFQLTNILRDYREDYDARRVYLPQEVFERHGITPEDLYYWRDGRSCEAMLRELIECAEAYYERSRGLEAMISADCRPTLRVMTGIYHGLLERISGNPSSIARGARVRLSSLEKLTIVGGALWRQRGSARAAASAAT